MKFYLDESGNTGTNWLDTDQPYFVYGGWLLLDSNIIKAETIVSDFSTKIRAQELKSSRLIEKRLDDVISLFYKLSHEANALPVVTITDKRFMVSIKIVETFFDPCYNRQLNNSITYDFSFKTALAEVLNNDTTLINDFSQLIRKGTISLNEMRNIKNEIASLFHYKKLDTIAKCIDALNDSNLDEMIGEYEYLSKNGAEKKWLTLTEPLMNLLLKNINTLRILHNEALTVIPDNISGYADVFKESELFGNNILRNNSTVCADDSKNSKLIQASDLLCGFIARSFKSYALYSQKTISVQYWQNLLAIAKEFSQDNIQTIGYILPYEDINIFAKLSGCEDIETNNPIDTLSTDFTKFLI